MVENIQRHQNRPLAGLKIVDFTQMLAGPYCAMLMADLGADVVKIEPPTGDTIRTAGPFRMGRGSGEVGGYFMSVNRNKRSAVFDLKSVEGVETILDLVADADVVLENFRSGVMDRLGLSYEVMKKRNPRLVYGVVRGFGDERFGESAYSDWPAFDIVAQAMGGLQWMTGEADGPPMKAGVGIGDILPGTLLAVGVLAAVLRARETGQGDFVDVSMYDAVLSLTERIVYQYSYDGVAPSRQGNSHPYFEPFGSFEAADGWIAIAATTDRFWAALTDAMGRPDLVESYPTNFSRSDNAVVVRGFVADWIAQHTRAEIMAALGGRVPVGPVNTAEDIFRDPYVRERGMLVELDDAVTGVPAVVAGCPIKFLDSPQTTYTPAPSLGEHTDQVNDELVRSRNES